MNTSQQIKTTFLAKFIDDAIKDAAATIDEPSILIEGPVMLEKIGFKLLTLINKYFDVFTRPEFQNEILKIVDPSIVANVMNPLVVRLPGYVNKLIESKFIYWIHHPNTSQKLQDVLIQLFNKIIPQESKVKVGGFSQDDCF